jgi:hypothetical protein
MGLACEFGCNWYAEEGQLGLMDARRDTAVMPCGLKVHTNSRLPTAASNVETGNLEDLGAARILDPH